MMSRRRWLGSWSLMAVTYLGLGVPRLATGDVHSAMVFLAMAAATLAFAAATLPIMAPRRHPAGAPPGEDDGPGPGGGGGPAEDPPPQWWPEFEREFWSSLRDRDPGPGDRTGAGV